jgi:uncharacterized membrane protein
VSRAVTTVFWGLAPSDAGRGLTTVAAMTSPAVVDAVATVRPSRGIRSRIAWGWIAFSSVTVVVMAVSPYLMSSLRTLAESPAGLAGAYVDQPLGIQIAFYVHVVFGGIALLAGPAQFARGIRSRWPRVHRTIGRVSLVAIVVAAGAALVIVPVNSAGLIGVAGFGSLAVLWALFAILGFRAIRRRDVAQHRAWMTRAFALTYAAVTLRLWLPLLIVLHIVTGTDPDAAFTAAYAYVPFLAWVPNLIVAELLVRRRRAELAALVD